MGRKWKNEGKEKIRNLKSIEDFMDKKKRQKISEKARRKCKKEEMKIK